MKVINKILCFLSVLVLCVPLLCFNVGAEDVLSSVGNVFKDSYSSLLKSKYLVTDEDKYYSSSDLSKYRSCYFGTNTSKVFHIPFDYFQDSLFLAAYYSSRAREFENLYYISFSKGDSFSNYSQLVIYSESPITLVSTGSYVTYTSKTTLYYGYYGAELDEIDGNKFYIAKPLSFNDFYSVYDVKFSEKIPIKYVKSTSSLKNCMFTPDFTVISSYTVCKWDRVYSNCGELDITLLPNVTDSNLKPYGLGLSDQIDVKLTPEFGLDMDRVFDKNTGQNDYFKFEITNNSDTNIQFCASIVDEQKDVIKNAISGTILDGILRFDYKDWEEGYWNYITDSQYYADCYEVEEELFGLAHDYKRYAELRKGNFYWVLLKPGEKFEDFIYWENVNIKANTKYSFIVDCVPTKLDYPTDVFYALDELTGVKVFSHTDELDDRQYSKDESLEKYALNKNECVQVCNYVFSIKSIPDFTTEIKGGNSKTTSGWNDTVKQSTNPYYREDTRTGEIKAVNNYSEYKGNLPDVDVDIDNLSVDNIKSYITYSQNFFSLLKSIFQTFPSLWILIVFGLTAIIVIAIVRYIRG